MTVKDKWTEYDQLEDRLAVMAAELGISVRELKSVRDRSTSYIVIEILKAQLQILIDIRELSFKWKTVEPYLKVVK